MLIGSLLGAPLGLAEVFFTDYWMPAFEKIELVSHLYLEDIILCFSLGGLSVGVYTLLAKGHRPISMRPWFILIIPACISLALIDPLGWSFMNYMLVSMAMGAVYILAVHPARKEIFLSALINDAIYIAIFAVIWHASPSVRESYLSENLLGLNIFGIPLEEFLWAGLFAVIWAPIYESLAPFLTKTQSKRSR